MSDPLLSLYNEGNYVFPKASMLPDGLLPIASGDAVAVLRSTFMSMVFSCMSGKFKLCYDWCRLLRLSLEAFRETTSFSGL